MEQQNSLWVSLLMQLGTFLTAIIASSGFWLFVTKRRESKDLRNRLLMGLAHDRIIYLGMYYIGRKYITQDEYENLHEYLYKPYEEMGGNGSARRIMCEVDKLPIHKNRFTEITQENDKC